MNFILAEIFFIICLSIFTQIQLRNHCQFLSLKKWYIKLCPRLNTVS